MIQTFWFMIHKFIDKPDLLSDPPEAITKVWVSRDLALI